MRKAAHPTSPSAGRLCPREMLPGVLDGKITEAARPAPPHKALRLGLIMAQKARHARTNPNCHHIIQDRVMGTRDPQRERPDGRRRQCGIGRADRQRRGRREPPETQDAGHATMVSPGAFHGIVSERHKSHLARRHTGLGRRHSAMAATKRTCASPHGPCRRSTRRAPWQTP